MKLKQLNVFIIGLGQIGGSIARALTTNRSVANVYGYDIDETVGKLAEDNKYISNLVESISDGFDKADLIILATPIRMIFKLIPEIIKKSKPNQIVLDVAGIQSGILEIVSKQNNQTNYISGHPIAGNEGTGLEASSANKFRNTIFFLSPAESTNKESIDIVVELIKALDAIPVKIEPDKHDFLVSMTINLPYMIALTLMKMAAGQESSYEDFWQLAGGSFKGATRVASSSPELTLDMFMTNRDNILNIIEIFQAELTEVAEMISRKDEDALRARIDLAKTQKDHMNRVQNG